MTENGGRVPISHEHHAMQSGRLKHKQARLIGPVADWVATGAMNLHILLYFERSLVAVWAWHGMA